MQAVQEQFHGKKKEFLMERTKALLGDAKEVLTHEVSP
jgi:hypothetical protein